MAVASQLDAPRIETESYEHQLNCDLERAMTEGSLFFEERGAVQETLRDVAARLEQIGVPYAVCGGMALFAHGFRRYTEDVDILVSEESRLKIHSALSGRGYLPPHETSPHLRNTETKVKVEFLVSGRFPGDGKPKPVAFPDPASEFVVLKGIRYLSLRTLIELKLASGLSASHRGKDLTDVNDLIKALSLPRELSSQLDATVQAEYLRQWSLAHTSTQRFVRAWRLPTVSPKPISTIDDVIAIDPGHAETLQGMQADGVWVEPHPRDESLVKLVTSDPVVAERWQLDDEALFKS